VPFNIIHGRVLPIELEALHRRNACSKLLSFSDPLVLGPRSGIQPYNATQRFNFWEHVCEHVFGKNSRKYQASNFWEEEKKYEIIKKALLDCLRLNIWISNNPNEILLFATIANMIKQHGINRHDITLSMYDNQAVQTKYVSEGDIGIYADVWNLCSSNIHAEENFQVWTSVCQNCPHVSFLHQCIKFLCPSIYGDITLLSEIDKELLQKISNSIPVKSHIIVADIVEKYYWLGDVYPFYRLYHLSRGINAIIPDNYNKRFNQISYTRTLAGEKYIENGIADMLTKTKYTCHAYELVMKSE